MIAILVVALLPAAGPFFDGSEHLVALFAIPPNRFVLLQPDFVLSLARAIFLAAKVRQVGDPQHAVDRDVLLVDHTENFGHSVSPQAGICLVCCCLANEGSMNSLRQGLAELLAPLRRGLDRAD